MLEKRNVLIRCSDGWDRTSQLCSLSQVMLDPFFRTKKGFMILIEKDWLNFGHQFHLRFGHYDPNYKQSQRSPVFIQFLDTLRQIVIQFPNHFEYNEDMLLFIANELFKTKYGTFLGNSVSERKRLCIKENSKDIWSDILGSTAFTNTNFNADAGVIESIPETSYLKLHEWRAFFFKWSQFGISAFGKTTLESH